MTVTTRIQSLNEITTTIQANGRSSTIFQSTSEPIMVTLVNTGIVGEQGPPGESGIAGYAVNLSSLKSGDLIVFDGVAFVNENKTEISDGGSF